MKKKKYIVDGTVYEIPDNESVSFLKDFPHAKVQYDIEGKTYEIPHQEADAFETDMGLKKKPSSNVSANGSQNLSTTTGTPDVDIPEVSLEPGKGSDERLPDNTSNPIDLAQRYGELKDKTKIEGIDPLHPVEVEDEGKTINVKGAFFKVGGTKEAKDLAKFMQEQHGIDVEDLHNETKGLTPNDFGREGFDKNTLLADREENNQLYNRKLGRLKWQSGLENILSNNLAENNISKDEYDNIHGLIQSSLKNASVGDYDQQRRNIKSIGDIIKIYGGENKDKLLSDYAVEAGKVYGNSYKSPSKEETPESKYLDPNQELGYQYLKDVSPEKTTPYERIFVDPKSIEKGSDEEKGYNHLKQTLEETGLMLQKNAVNEDLNNLIRISKKNGGLTPEQLKEAEELQKKDNELNIQKDELDTKYPDRLTDKVEDAMQEIMGQRITGLNYGLGRTGLAFKNTGKGIWEAVSEPFMSDESNKHRELAIMGESLNDENVYHKTDENKALNTDKLVIEPELRKQIDAIKNDKSLTDEQKQKRIYPLLYENKDKFGRVAIQGGKFNINPSSIMYGVTDLAANLAPFVVSEALTGGGATAGAGRKLLATFTSALATSFHDEYASEIKSGKSQSEAYKDAMGMAAITSAAMAGAGTASKVRSFFQGKTSSAAELIKGMSDDAIEKVLAKGTPKGLQGIKQAIKERVKATPAMLAKGAKTGAEFEGAMTLADEAKHQIYNTPMDREQRTKQSLINIATFGLLGLGGHLGYKSPTELQKSTIAKFGEKPDDFIKVAEQMKKDGQLSPAEFDHRKALIEKSAEAFKNLPTVNDKGKPLTEKDKSDYLYNSVIKNQAKKDASTLPPKQADKAEHDAMVADFKMQEILTKSTDIQLENQLTKVEKELNKVEWDASGKKIEMPEKDKKLLEAQRDAISETIEERKKEVSDTKLSEPIEGLNEQGVPEDIIQPIELSIETPENKQQNEAAKETEVPNPETPGSVTDESTNPVIEPAGEEKITGVKREITDATRAANGMPKVEFPKMSSDTDALSEAKKRVDSGEVNPQEMVNRILTDKTGYKNEGEVMDMQYYAHQLEKRNQELSKDLSEAKTPEQEAEIRGQKLQLSDLMDAQTEAAQTAGNQWGKIGNRMQPVINDAGQIFRQQKADIKEAYGGEIPADVKLKIDAITKERDEAIVAKEKVEAQLRGKMATQGFEEVKKRAAKESKTKQTKEQLKTEAEDLIRQLKEEIKGKPDAPQKQGLPITDKMVVIVGKLAINYVKQGIKNIEQVIDRIKDHVQGYSRDEIKGMIAQFNETDRLNKKADLLEKQMDNPLLEMELFLKSQGKEQKTYRTSNEWVKANQRVANAEFKMKIEKRKAFESQKNWYQKGLMWFGRLTRLSVLSGYNVLGKLAAAATVGAAAKRPVEQIIGGVYSKIFSGIAKKAPIEGGFNWLNAKAEAAWYKDFFNPKKFGKNSWEILKSGSTPLGKRLGSAEYEHVPLLYLPTDLHQIIKDPVKRGTFEASFKNGMIWAEKNGLDINDPLVINSLENAAYKRAQYEIFQEQNWLSKKFTSYKSSLEKAGNTGATAKMLVDFMIPVSTVPANIVRRLTTTSPLGLIRGGKEVVEAYRKGIESLTPEQADHVMMQLKQGTLGTALWLIGWYGASQFGGLYSKFNPNKKRDSDELVSDEMIVGGKPIPKPVQHALPLEVIQMAATARHIFDEYNQDKNETTPKSLAMAAMGSIGAGLEQIPVLETGVHLVEAAQDPYYAKKLGEDVKRRFEPQILRETGVIPKDEPEPKGGKKKKPELPKMKTKPQKQLSD